jgi:hypothetical protein
VLEGSLVEGTAELVAELIAGKVAYSQVGRMVEGREKEIETKFAADIDKTDVSDWLYNGTQEKPGDLGYWVGYRIVKTYYQHASNKQQALRAILEMTDPRLSWPLVVGIPASSFRKSCDGDVGSIDIASWRRLIAGRER